MIKKPFIKKLKIYLLKINIILQLSDQFIFLRVNNHKYEEMTLLFSI